MEAKKVTRAGLDLAITKMIRKSDKAPASFYKLKRVAKETATDIKGKGKKLKIPWGLLLIIIPGLIGIYLAFTSRPGQKDKGGISPGDNLDQAVDLKGREIEGLKKDFDFQG